MHDPAPEARFTGERAALIRAIFPHGVPRLWCPLLTHYTAAPGGGVILDRARLTAHVRSMQPWVKGFLIPGSTGEGWEMTDEETRALLEMAAEEVRAIGGQILAGVLKTDAQAARDAIAALADWLKQRSGKEDILAAMADSAICAFTICPPSGATLGQDVIAAELAATLGTGLPFALYQLPQVTKNEMSPDTLFALAAVRPNFFLFKDTSGTDSAVKAGFREVFLLRGAEGDYTEHLAEGGGAYDGFLLSTANCFARQLAAMMEHMAKGERDAAEDISEMLTAVCAVMFTAAGQVGFGNAFTNATKAMDHIMAHGADALAAPPPLLHSGFRLPPALIQAAHDELAQHGLVPEKGYLAP
jgi:dihydrodipicolinate synthase/N-acetylneuraminate lyase